VGFNRTAAKAYLVLASFIAAAILAYVLNNDYVLWSALPSTNSILIVLAYYFGQPLYDLFIFLFSYNVYKTDKSLGSAIRGTVASIIALVGLDVMSLPHVTSSILSFGGTLTLVPNPLLTPFGGYQLIRFIAGPSGVVTFWNDFGSQVIFPVLLLGAALVIAEPHWFIEIVGGVSSKRQNQMKAYLLLIILILATIWSYLLNNQYDALRSFKPSATLSDSYDVTLSLGLTDPRGLVNRALALQRDRRFDEALKCLEQVIALRPNFAEALINRGNILQQLKRHTEARASYDRALIINPDSAQALNNRGIALQALECYAEALESYDRALSVKPDHVNALNNRGVILKMLKRFDEALQSYERALILRPGYAEALSNRGLVFADLARFDEALECFEQALATTPGFAAALSNRGLALQELGRFAEAMESYDQALALYPEYHELRFNQALLLLLMGRFGEGWQEYEFRRKVSNWIARTLPGPEWDGAGSAGRRLLFYSEQGLGDTIQFSRFAGMIAATGADVFLEVQPALENLVRGLKGVTVIRKGEPLPEHDAHLPLMSIPHVLKLVPETMPAGIPYLIAEPARIEAWAKRLPGGRVRVGITWQGRPDVGIGGSRSIPLQACRQIGPGNRQTF
jgi:tetratricopeptide (TPR) repeat protein